MALLTYSHKRALYLGGSVIAIAILFPTVFSILFAAADEVSYSAGIDSSTCTDFLIQQGAGAALCTTRYGVVVGNTGTNKQDLVTVELYDVPSESRVGWSALDLVATSVRPTGPEVTEVALENGLRLVIADLAANRLVQFSLVARGPESIAQLQRVSVAVQANGRVIETNPHLTVVSRFVRNVFGVFGI